MLGTIRAYLSRIDERPVEEIDRDIEHELAAHLGALEDELVESGLTPDAARRQALSRFGNPVFYGRQCRDVALRERRMKTYAQVIVAAACGAVFMAAAGALWAGQQSTNTALVSMNARLDEMSRAAGMRTPGPATGVSSVSSVYITGAPVTRPGQYALPAEGTLTLRRLLAVAGVDARFVKMIMVRPKEYGGPRSDQSFTGAMLMDPAGEDRALKPDDLITVYELDR